MPITSKRAGLAIAIAAASAVAGTAVAQSDGGSPAPAADVLVAPRGTDSSIADDALVASGQPSTWVPITPYRAWDSRNNPGFRLFSLDEGGQALALNILFDEDDELAIPQTATGVTFNVTIVDQAGGGFLTVAEINQPTEDARKTSTINWAGPGSPIANGSSVALGSFEGTPGYVKLLVGGVASGTEYIIDVTGYYTDATAT